MKRIFLMGCAVVLSLVAVAQPKFVGHRGSLWGVESSREALINGAKAGYQYLESDVKVAGDGTFVLCHDNTTERLGGALNVASATIDELKNETYTQTRKGVSYSGKICTLAEFLDICNEYGVKPVIELKWATGVNNNDCSNIPSLVSLIEEKGFRNNCVILTSMKTCLEYIRTNYPDITLQFLGRKNWAEHFDWCVKYGLDVDIEGGCFDGDDVARFHNAGLKVNVWTINDETDYKMYVDYGCDFITTDCLDIKSLTEPCRVQCDDDNNSGKCEAGCCKH